MGKMRIRAHKEAADALAHECGITVVGVEITGNCHIKATFQRSDGERRFFIWSSTSKNLRSKRNRVADVRRWATKQEASA